MSQWDTRVRDNVVWAELQQSGMTIDNALNRDNVDAESIAGLERLRLVLSLIGKRLASTDPLLITPTALTNLSASVNKVRSEIEAFTVNGSVIHITNANNYGDEAILYLGQVPGPVTAEDIAIISAAASNYRTTIEGYLERAQLTHSALEVASKSNAEKIAAQEVAITAEQARLTTIFTEQQSQFSAAQDARASTFSTVTAEQKSLFSADQDSRKSLFSDYQLENQKSFTAVLTDYSNKIKDHEVDMAARLERAEETHIESLEELRVQYGKSADDILVEINKQKDAVESLVGVIGNLGVTSGYQKVANYARKMLWVWQGLTVAALVGLIWVAYTVSFPPLVVPTSSPTIVGSLQLAVTKDESSERNIKSKKDVTISAPVQVKQAESSEFAFFQGLATRIFLSITFGIFAAYAAKQAGRFFEMEQQNRRRALELEALGPFIEPLEKIDRDKFRVQVGERSFAVPDKDSPEYKENDPVTALSLLKPKEWVEGVVSIIKASKN